jgi:D-glucosaminate-6-phosphate ammonia-lyase
MEVSNRCFVSMKELLEKSGKEIARLVTAEAARVTPGACAALVVGIAACMTGMDCRKWEQLPDTSEIKDEVIIQRGHRYRYDRCAEMAGARVVEVGDDAGTTIEQIAAAIQSRTAAILFPAHLDAKESTIGLAEVVALGRSRRVPIFVDAAFLSYPTELMLSFVSSGADLVCFSSKYFGGPNAGGFICGRKDLIEIVTQTDFIGYELGQYRTFGRQFKLDRQTIVGILAAFQNWMTTDHTARLETYARKVEVMAHRIGAIPGIVHRPLCFAMGERLVPAPVNCLAVSFEAGGRLDAQQICDFLADGDPAIAAFVLGRVLVLAVEMLIPGEELIVANRLKAALLR